MNYWLYIKDKLNDRIALSIHLLFLILGAYVFIMADKHILLKTPLVFVGLLSWFFLRDKTKHPIIWIVFFMLLIVDLYYSYFWVANHHFMLLFMVLSIILYRYHKNSAILRKNIQWLLVIVVMASALQKLMSSQFMSGDFYYYMVNRGSLFRFFINFFPESLEVTKSNSERLFALHATNPNITQGIVLKDTFSSLGKISHVYAWITVVIEFLAAIAILWKPKSTWAHLLLIVMIIGILCARFETGFMALLAICGVFLCTNLKLRLLYVMIVLACITFIITKIGYH